MNITPVQAGSVSITANRSGSSQKEMTKDGVGGKAFPAKKNAGRSVRAGMLWAGVGLVEFVSGRL